MYPNPNPYPNAAPAPSYAKQFQYVKDFLKRPIVYITTILLTLQFIVSIITGIAEAGIAQWESLSSSMEGSGLNSTLLMVSRCFGWVFSGVFILGAWLACLKSSNRNPASSPATGLAILKVLSIISIVFMGMAFVIEIIAVIILAAAGSSITNNYNYGKPPIPYNNPAMTSTFILIGIIILLFVFGVVLFYYISMLRFTSSLQASLKSPLLKSGGSLPFAVLSIIFAVFDCFALIIIADISSDPGGVVFNKNLNLFVNLDWILAAICIVSLSVQICFAILGFSYHSYAEKVNAEISASSNPYPQAYPGFPVPPPPMCMLYPGQPVNPPYPTAQQNCDKPAPPEYTNPYFQNEASAQHANETEQPRICPVCGTPVTDPRQTNCNNCGAKF